MRHRSWSALIGIAGVLLTLSQGLSTVPDWPGRDERTLQVAGIEPTGPALLQFFRTRTLAAARLGQVPAFISQLGHRDYAQREQATAELLAIGKGALPALHEAVKSPDPEIAMRARRLLEAISARDERGLLQAALRTLARKPTEGVVEVLLAYLAQAGDPGLEEEVASCLAIAGVRDGQVDAALLRAADSTQPLQRLAAAAALTSAGPARRDDARRFLSDADVRVRWHTARLLLAQHDQAAVPTLIGLIGDGPIEIARQADDLLGRLAGKEIPPVGLGMGEPGARAKCQQSWQAWWQGPGRGVDLARLNLKLDADLDLEPLVSHASRLLRDVLDGNQNNDIKAERGRMYGGLIAVYAQNGPAPISPLRATLRDAGLRLAATSKAYKFDEVRKQLDGLASLNPDRQAIPGKAPLFNGQFDLCDLMLSFGGPRSGGLLIERQLLNLEKDWKHQQKLPDTLLNDDLIRTAAHIARITEAIQDYKPDFGPANRKLEWQPKAEDARKAAIALGQAVRAGNGAEAYRGVIQVLRRCDACHEVFR